ncbi:hypothetical protein H5T89_12745 [bacterium]|nr:hypothetical protein [bacterium]
MREIYLVPHFHCDPVWIADQNMYQEGGEDLPRMTRHPLGFLDLVRAYLDCCRRDEEYAILFSELDYLKPYWDMYPEDRGFIRYLVSRRRLDVGGAYSEPNENSIGEEALVRNIFYGMVFHKFQLGADPKVYLPLDVFGHTIQLSQILKKSGFLGCVWSKHVVGFPSVFYHMSLDGSILPYRRVDYGGHFQNIDVLKEDLSLRFEELESMGIDVDLRFIGGDSDPPTDWLTGRSKELRMGKVPIILSGPSRYIEELINRIKGKRFSIPYSSRDMAFYHIGTSLSRIELKIANRLGEIKLLKAERFATIASLFGAKYPCKALDKAWRQLLFNQHHDAITGTSGDKPYVDLMMGYRESLRLSSFVLDNSLKFLASLIDTEGNGIPIVVFNSLNWQRSDLCKVELPLGTYKIVDTVGNIYPSLSVENGNNVEVIFRGDDIPPLGYKVFFATPAIDKKKIVKDKGTVIENEFYRIEVDPANGGRIKSLIYKGKELVKEGKGMNELFLLKEDPNRKEPSWEVFTTGERISSSEFPAEVEREKSELYERLTIIGNIGDICKFKQIITLYKGIERIEFLTDIIDYKKKTSEDDMFVVIFSTNLENALPTFEDRFGALTRRKSKGYLDFRSWQWRNYSGCGIYPAYRWMDLGPSVTIRVVTSSVSVGLTDIIIPHNNEIESIVPILLKSLANRGITASIMYDDNDKERRSRLLSEDNTLPSIEEDIFATFRISIGLPNNIYIDKVLSKLPKEIVERFQRAIEERGYGILLVEDDIPILIISAKDISNLIEVFARIDKDLEDRVIDLSEDEGYISYREVPSYGLTLINKGNISNSVENDGTIVMLLQHTAKWSGKHFAFDFIPEEGTHRFIYALYPHKGTWAEAKSYRKAMEFNFSLDGIVTSSHSGQLPKSYNFINFGDSDIILTALKLEGAPLAGPIGDTNSSDIIIRVYEPCGKETSFDIYSGFPILRVSRADLMENDIAPVSSFHLTPFSIETYKLSLKRNPLKYAEYDVQVEPHQPVYVRYWRHNAGASPIGNLPIVASLRGEGDKIVLYVANDLVDRKVLGRVNLRSVGIELDKSEIEFNLSPSSYAKYEIASYRDDTSGIVEAIWEYEGQSYKDVLILGELRPLEVSFRDEKMHIYNPNQFDIEGEIIIGAPIELWGKDFTGEFSFGTIPERFNFYCEPNREYTLEINYKHPGCWSIVKLAYMGKTLYLRR